MKHLLKLEVCSKPNDRCINRMTTDDILLWKWFYLNVMDFLSSSNGNLPHSDQVVSVAGKQGLKRKGSEWAQVEWQGTQLKRSILTMWGPSYLQDCHQWSSEFKVNGYNHRGSSQSIN